MTKEQTEVTQQIGISMSLPPVIVKSIDIMRGGIPRSAYLRNIIINAVEETKNKKATQA